MSLEAVVRCCFRFRVFDFIFFSRLWQGVLWIIAALTTTRFLTKKKLENRVSTSARRKPASRIGNSVTSACMCIPNTTAVHTSRFITVRLVQTVRVNCIKWHLVERIERDTKHRLSNAHVYIHTSLCHSHIHIVQRARRESNGNKYAMPT